MARGGKQPAFGLEVKGDAHLQKALQKLTERPLRGVLTKAMTAATSPIRKAMRESVPLEHGWLKKSLGTRQRFYRRKQVVFAAVGPRNRPMIVEGRKVNPVKYTHLVEFGTKPHSIVRKRFNSIKNTRGGLYLKQYGRFARRVRHPGTRASGFMRRAYSQTAPPAFRAFGERAWLEIKKEVQALKAHA